MVQLAFADNAPDVGVMHRSVANWKSTALMPPRLIALKRTNVVPVLVTVSVCGALRRPTGVSGKFRGFGVRVKGARPLPVRTACGVPTPSLVTMRLATRGPAA